MKINENLYWVEFDEYHFKASILEAKIFKNKKFSIDIFWINNKKENNTPINGFVCQSLISKEYIIIVRIDMEKFKDKKVSLEQVRNEINKEISKINQLIPYYLEE